jgi:hypothetical protein
MINKKSLVVAAAFTLSGLSILGAAPVGAELGECGSFSVSDPTVLYAPGNDRTTQGPWIPVMLPAGSLIDVQVTTYDPTHDTHPEANMLQQNEIIVLEMQLADGGIVRTPATGDIPDGVTSAGPFNLGQFGPYDSDVVQIRQVHGALFSGDTTNRQSVHGIDAIVQCSEETTTTTEQVTTTIEEVTTTTEEVTTTTEATTTSTSVPESSTSAVGSTEPPTSTTVSETTAAGHVPTLPVTGPGTTGGLLLLGGGFVTFGAALIMSSRERAQIL